jgi:DNA-binding beta-propeller fold protein YncE
MKKNSLIFVGILLLFCTNTVSISPKAYAATYPPTGSSRYLYVFPDGKMYVYDMDNSFNLVYSRDLPMSGKRGVAVHPGTSMLYLSYGSNSNNPGSLMKYNLKTNTIVWNKQYQFGVDSISVTPDGNTLYVPAGEESSSNLWYVVNTGDGSVRSTISAGSRPHNTVVSLNGQRAYLSGVGSPYVAVVDTATNTVTKTIGQLISGGRPFTINGSESLLYTTASGYLGFQVSSITTGQVLFTVPVVGYSGSGSEVPSHGISLSPDEKELYVIDGKNSYVHVFDVSNLPALAPTKVASIKLSNQIIGNIQSGCSLDCDKVGWLLHSRSGKYVAVGDSGDIIDTTTRQIVKNIGPLANTRIFAEVDWQNGSPYFSSSRHGLGYNLSAGPTPTPGQTQSVTSFTLINADTDQPISGYDPITNNATINLNTLPTKNINIRANTNPSTVGSVRFALDGNNTYRIENNAPYALESDEGGNYYTWNATTGSHTITATPYTSQNAIGTPGTGLTLTITFANTSSVTPTPSSGPTVTPTQSPTGQSVVSFTLINADTDQPIAGFDPLLNNATIQLSTLPTKNINVRANTNPSIVGSVRFGFDGNTSFQTENYIPYALASDDDGNYRPWTPSIGSHTISATPYTSQNAGGTTGSSTSVTVQVGN